MQHVYMENWIYPVDDMENCKSKFLNGHTNWIYPVDDTNNILSAGSILRKYHIVILIGLHEKYWIYKGLFGISL